MFKQKPLPLILSNSLVRPTSPQNYHLINSSSSRNIIELSSYIGWWDDEALWLKDYLREREGQEIEIHIASDGGDVFTGQHMYNVIKAHKGKTVAYIQRAFSIAGYIAMACNEVKIVAGSQMMIHAVSGRCDGTEADHIAYVELLRNASGTIAQAFVDKTGHDLGYFSDLMKTDSGKYFTDNECLELGLADEIIQPSSMTNTVSKNNEPPPDTAHSTEPLTEPEAPPATPQNNSTSNLINNVSTQNMPELARQQSIRKIFNSLQPRLNLPMHLYNAAIDDTSVDAQTAMMTFSNYVEPDGDDDEGDQSNPVNLGFTHKPGNNRRTQNQHGGAGSDSINMVRNVLMNRAGAEDLNADNRDYAGMSLMNAASAMGIRGAGDTLYNNALDNPDFTTVIGEIAQRSVQLEVEGAVSLAKMYTKEVKKTKLGEFGVQDYHQAKALGKRGANGEFPMYTFTGDVERKGIIEEFGRNVVVTRKAFINDEFHIITDLPRQFVNAAYRSSDRAFIQLLLEEAKTNKIQAADMKLLMIAMANAMESRVTSDGDDLHYSCGQMLANSANKRIAKQINDSQYSDGVGTANTAYSTFNQFGTSTRLGELIVGFADGISPVEMAVIQGREDPTLIQNPTINPINGMGFGIVWDFGMVVGNEKALVLGQVAASREELEAYEKKVLAAEVKATKAAKAAAEKTAA